MYPNAEGVVADADAGGGFAAEADADKCSSDAGGVRRRTCTDLRRSRPSTMSSPRKRAGFLDDDEVLLLVDGAPAGALLLLRFVVGRLVTELTARGCFSLKRSLLVRLKRKHEVDGSWKKHKQQASSTHVLMVRTRHRTMALGGYEAHESFGRRL